LQDSHFVPNLKRLQILNHALMNPDTPMRYLLAAALIVDAIAGHLLYRSAFFEPSGDQPVLAATGLALLVARWRPLWRAVSPWS